MDDRRCKDTLRHLVAAGNLCALAASDPDRFGAEDRDRVVKAWDAALEALRQQSKGDKHGNDSAR